MVSRIVYAYMVAHTRSLTDMHTHTFTHTHTRSLTFMHTHMFMHRHAHTHI